ncbi:hypothetical protein KP509_39G048600 [Ceratopteris richardii]|uniref:C2H2-type domain-containing protein n=1 Tax=Ceratopteris richardii TaxID=49495 RepID=A0A8T2Q0D2_CERRI|nr:hypothetical protein KP509_39G048600 [Ceratopteris richardii]
MPTSWLSWKRPLVCKTQPGEVHDPKALNADYGCSRSAKVDAAAVFVSRRVYMRSGCSRSIANLKDVINSSRRIDGSSRAPGMPNFSPKSVESNDFVQSISHETLVHEHGCDAHKHYNHGLNQKYSPLNGKLISLDDIVASHHPHPHQHSSHRSDGTAEAAQNTGSGSFYGTPLHPSLLRRASAQCPATPVHHSQYNAPAKGSSFRKLSGCYDCKNPAVSLVVYKASSHRNSTAGSMHDPSQKDSDEGTQGSLNSATALKSAVCQRCGETFPKFEALEQHHLLKHAVAELPVGDSSRNVVEIIFRTSWLRLTDQPPSTMALSEGTQLRIERVLKVNNLARTLARFEDYREGVKIRASKLPKKHPRCLADGNELLRFYAARLECDLLQTSTSQGVGERESGSSAGPMAVSTAAACGSSTCSICRIIRMGFPKMRGPDGVPKGILTTATSGRAHQLLMQSYDALASARCSTGEAAADRRQLSDQHKISAPGSGAMCGAQLLQTARGEGDVSARSNRHDDGSHRRRGGGSERRDEQINYGSLRAMLVCRVIAGRVLKPPATSTTSTPQTPPHSGDLGPPSAGFDSIAGGEMQGATNGSIASAAAVGMNMGLHSRFEELTVFNPRAILPCFVVLYRC